MTAALYGLRRLCARHRLVVVLAWVVTVVVLAGAAHQVGQQTTDNLSLPGTDSQRATDVLTHRFPAQANGAIPITLQAPKGAKLTDTQYETAVQQVASAYGKDPAVAKVVSPFSSAGASQLTKDGRLGYISLTLKDSAS